MSTIADELIKSASASRQYLNRSSRKAIATFIRSKWHPNGGFCGRDERGDLYYTLFGILSLRALNASIPLIRLWNYLNTFGKGESLDLVHYTCFVQLRALFPLSPLARTQLIAHLKTMPTQSAYDQFISSMAMQTLLTNRAEIEHPLSKLPTPKAMQGLPTTTLAALSINQPIRNEALIDTLKARYCEGGGFRATTGTPPDLLSTATALFALQQAKAQLADIMKPCLYYTESLWRASGGFAGWLLDETDDVEYTAYGLISIGSLMRP